MTRKKQRLLDGCVAVAFAAGVGTVYASGFQLMEQNASGLGNAYAGQGASAQDASTIFFNPAGMTLLPGKNAGTVGINVRLVNLAETMRGSR